MYTYLFLLIETAYNLQICHLNKLLVDLGLVGFLMLVKGRFEPFLLDVVVTLLELEGLGIELFISHCNRLRLIPA